MSTTFTIRLPKQLAEKMRKHKEINWSEVIRRAIEDYLNAIEETRTTVPAEEVIDELKREGVSQEDLKPLEASEEKRLYEEMVRRKWKRLSTIPAP